jgi:LacI family transcriptional regulator
MVHDLLHGDCAGIRWAVFCGVGVDKNTSRRKRTKSPTISDVARLAQVSVSTAARVLRDADYPVHPALAKRVRAVVDRVGYVPNRLARTLRGASPDAVGLIVGTMLDPYHGTIAEAVTRRAEAAHSFVAVVCNMQRDPLLELKYCRQLLEHRVAGVILSGGGFDQWTHQAALADVINQMVDAGVKVVTLTPRGLDVPVFSVDNEEAGRLTAEQLVLRQHRRIGIILGPKRNEVTQLRLRGMTRTLRKANASYVIEHIDFSEQSGAAAVSSLFQRDPDLTAIICGSDTIGLGVIDWARSNGHNIPGDLSVVSIGNTNFAKSSQPPLSSVDVELARTGEAALDFLVAAARGQPVPSPIEFHASFVPRSSVGPPRAEWGSTRRGRSP